MLPRKLARDLKGQAKELRLDSGGTEGSQEVFKQGRDSINVWARKM